MGRNELRRGLRALSAATRSNAGISEGGREGTPTRPLQGDDWTEHDIDKLFYGLDMLSSGEPVNVILDVGDEELAIRGNAELTDKVFREKMMLVIVDGGTKVDRDLATSKSMLPLFERLQVRMETRAGTGAGMRPVAFRSACFSALLGYDPRFSASPRRLLIVFLSV